MTNHEKQILKEIHHHTTMADNLYDSLSTEAKDRVREIHTEEFNFPYHLKWGADLIDGVCDYFDIEI